ncbi:MAG: hemolysin family protein [Nakamurella sp.]
MSSTDIWLLIISAILVPVAGALAAADAAISAVSTARVEELSRAGHRGAASLAAITVDRARYINLLLMLRLSAEMTATVIVAIVAVATWGFHAGVAVGVIAVMVVVSYVAIGVLPRTLGRQYPYAVGLALAGPTRGLGRVLAPVSRLLIAVGNALVPGRTFPQGPFSSDVELREMVDLAGDRGVVHESEREMLQSVFDLSGTIVREVMVPRTEVVWIESTKSLRQAVHVADRSGYSRIPVIGDNVDDVLGVVYVKDLITRLLSLADDDRGPQVADLMRPAVFVPESKAVDQLLRDMQRDRTHVAMVIDEYGGLAGIVTMEDIVEEIVGEITDEYDAEAPDPIEQLVDGSVRVSARLPVEDLGDLFDVELPSDDVETVGGLLAQLLGRVALPGSRVDIDGIRLQAEGGVDRRGRYRVMAVRAWRIDAGADAPLDDAPDDGAPGFRGADADPFPDATDGATAGRDAQAEASPRRQSAARMAAPAREDVILADGDASDERQQATQSTQGDFGN